MNEVEYYAMEEQRVNEICEEHSMKFGIVNDVDNGVECDTLDCYSTCPLVNHGK